MGKFVSWLVSAGLDEGRPIIGALEHEIAEIASSQGVNVLPKIYHEFLRDCGRSAGLFQRDADFFYPAIKSLKKELLEMLADVGFEYDVPCDAFVFGAYQGFQFNFFRCNEGDDPAVYQIDDGGAEPKLVCDSFSEYVLRSIGQYRQAFSRR